MAQEFARSELILNDDGSIYHLRLKKENVADTIILVGDPGRVSVLSSMFDTVDFRMENREFVTHTGSYKGSRITAISTGIGTDNIDIVINELDALLNIDLVKRQKKKEHKSLKFIRVGTTGGLQPDLKPGSFILSRIAGGFDGLLHFYRDGFQVCDENIEKAFVNHTGWFDKRPVPYFVHGSKILYDRLNDGIRSGITISCPGFYGPQGRQLRLPVVDPTLNEKIESFRCGSLKITNFEMESSALYGLSSMLGHEAVTICAVIANRVTGESVSDHAKVIKDLLRFTLEHVFEN